MLVDYSIYEMESHKIHVPNHQPVIREKTLDYVWTIKNMFETTNQILIIINHH